MKNLTKKQRKKLLANIYAFIGILIGIILSLPFLWMIFSSFQETASDVYSFPPKMPNFLNFKNYIYFIKEGLLLKYLKNTLIIVGANMIITITASVLVAYGFARFNGKGKNLLFAILLATMMLPWVVTMVPAYMLFAKLGWIGTKLPLIIPSIGGSAFYIFMLRQFFMTIPKELDDAAKIDGCSSFGILIRIILPNSKPILATITVLSFTAIWSDYVGPSIYLLSEDQFTLALGLQFLKTSNYLASPWHLLMAGSVYYALPMVILYLTSQKAFVQGAISSAIK